jgi:regulatory protein
VSPGDPFTYCLRLLKSRFKSRHELDEAMERRRVAPEKRAEVLARLVELDFVNDARFARLWLRSRDNSSPRGEPILRQELLQKGIAKDVIDQALRARRAAIVADEQPTDVTQATELLARKARQYAHLDPETRKRRQTAMLMRRGFSYDVIKRILGT